MAEPVRKRDMFMKGWKDLSASFVPDKPKEEEGAAAAAAEPVPIQLQVHSNHIAIIYNKLLS